MAEHNRRRSLADVLGVEAWHKRFSAKVEKADLHVDVVFQGDARLGGGETDDVRFRLGLRRADVVVVIPPGEPARIDPSSVARDAPGKTISLKETIASSRKGKVGGKAGAKAGHGVGLNLGLTIAGEAAASREQAMVIKRQLAGMTLIHSQTENGEHRWTVATADGDALFGRPWDATKQPRLKIVDIRGNRDGGLAPTVRVEVRCLREDLLITDIKLKDETVWDAMKGTALHRNRVAAAEALIRTLLFDAGLVHGDISDPYAQMTLASVVAESL